MQKGFIKKLLLLLPFVFVLNNNIYMYNADTRAVNTSVVDTCIVDTSVVDNYFFIKSEAIIDELESKFEPGKGENKAPVAQEFEAINRDCRIQLKNFKDVIKKLSSYDFKLKSMTYSKLTSAFTQIDDSVKSLHDTPSDLSQDDINDVVVAFDLLKEGIYSEVSLEHLLELKKFVIKKLIEIISLIDYWKFKLASKGVQGHIEEVFQKKDAGIKSKLRDLFYLKNRMSTFLGKIEEIMNNHLSVLDSRRDQNLDLDKLRSFTKESIFCVDSFFTKGFNPDVDDYDLRLESFETKFSNKGFKKFSANHMNVLLREKGSRYLLNDYKTPGFFKRNWLKLSIIGAAGTVAGVYFYNNWDDVSVKATKITNDSIGGLKNSYSNFMGMVKTKFGFDVPGEEEDQDNINLGEKEISEKLRPVLEEIEKMRDVFSASGQKLFGQKAGEKITLEDMKNKLTEHRSKLDESIKVVVGVQAVEAVDGVDAVEAVDGVEAVEAVEGIEGIEGVEAVDGLVKEFTQDINSLVHEVDNTLAALGVGEFDLFSDANRGHGRLPEEAAQKKWWGASFRNKITDTLTGEKNREAIHKTLLRVGLIIDRLDYIRNRNLDTGVKESFANLVQKFNEVSGAVSNVSGDMNSYLKTYEGLAHGMLGVTLNTVYNMILLAAQEGDKINNKLNVTINWVKAIVPVMITAVIIPLTSILIIRKRLKNKKLRKQAEINSTVIDIYRILNVNNMASVDIGTRDLSYKDQGLLVFFVNRLDLNVSRFFKSENFRLVALVDDLRNPNFNVAQKLDFIKAGWSYNLFEKNLAVAN